MKAGDHGPDEAYDKFRVFRTKTGEELTGRNEFILVLRPEAYDIAAQEAILCYASLIQNTYPGFAAELRRKIERIRARALFVATAHDITLEQAYRKISDERPGATAHLTREQLARTQGL